MFSPPIKVKRANIDLLMSNGSKGVLAWAGDIQSVSLQGVDVTTSSLGSVLRPSVACARYAKKIRQQFSEGLRAMAC